MRCRLVSIHIELVDDFVLNTGADPCWDTHGELPHFACADAVDMWHGNVEACDSLYFGLLGDEDIGSSDRISGILVVGFLLLFEDGRVGILDLTVRPSIFNGEDGTDR